MDALRAMFPVFDEGSLQAVLDMCGADVAAAADFLLGDGGQALAAAAAAVAAGGGGEVEEEEVEAEVEGEEEGEEEDEDNEDEEDEEEGHVEIEEDDDADESPAEVQSSAKRLRTVEPTDPAKLIAAGKSNFARFDARLMRKTPLDLINLMPSKLSHTSVTLWSDDVTDSAAALGMVSSAESGWWVHHFPTAEVDHVWRVLVNSHMQSKALGQVVHVQVAHSFAHQSEAVEVEVRVLVSTRQQAEPTAALRKAGAALLSIAPSSHSRPHIYFVRGALGPLETRAELEGRSEYKLSRERPSPKERESSAAASKLPGRPFQLIEPDRAHHQLYKADKASGQGWTKVDG
jgi:hypothetical protein